MHTGMQASSVLFSLAFTIEWAEGRVPRDQVVLREA
jgi:hypothetical protein